MTIVGHLSPGFEEYCNKYVPSQTRPNHGFFWHTFTNAATGERISGPFKDRREIIRNLCNRAGIRHFCFHALRHAGASLMDSQNVSIGSIQRISGHKNRITTEIYLHSIGETEREAISAYERAIQKVSHNSHTKIKPLRLRNLSQC